MKMNTDQYSFVPVQWREHYAKAQQRKDRIKMKPYHNKGFGLSFLAIVFFMLVFPAMILFVSLGTWDTFVKMHIPDGDCWENAKHERVCKGTVTCKIGRNFCE